MLRLFRFFRLHRTRGADVRVALRRAWKKVRERDLPFTPTQHLRKKPHEH